MIKFLHLSDVHLGCRRYNLEERTKDFFRSWHDVIVNHALPNEVDFVLIAGDFFDRRNIDPQTMNHALAGLQLLKDAAIPVLADALRDARGEGLFHILLLPPDVEGQLNRPIPALSVERLKELRSLVDYVALGHTHKRFELEGWAFNPGSLEACSIDEYREERGVYLVEVDDEHAVKATFIDDYVRRPFQRLTVDVSGAEDQREVHERLMETVKREARPHDPDSDRPAPIVEINLRGHLGFKNSLLDMRGMREEALAHTG